MKKITFEDINSLELKSDDKLKSFIVEDNTKMLAEWFYSEPGKEHYTLITSLSYLFEDSVLFDIGTFRGSSALALSSNEKNRVITYDIVDLVTHKLPNNVEKKIGDYKKDAELLSSPLIVFDCDPHDGKLEKEAVDFLTESGYNGIVLFDDIRLNDNMRQFWESVKKPKIDLTEKGHWSGTGIVFF